MITDGMWFEDEGHYQYYLRRTKEVRNAFERLQEKIMRPLIKRAKEYLKTEQAKEQGLV